MAGETEISGIALGLGIDVSPWSSGIAHARGEWEAFRADVAKGLNIPGGLVDIFGGKGGAISPTISPKFQVSRGAVQAMRVQINQELRQLSAGGDAAIIPLKLGRLPFGAMRTQIAAGIGEVPITVRIANVVGKNDTLTALVSTSTGSTMGAARTSIEQAAASRGIPKRAQGGPTTWGRPYLVGERGPEVVWPGTGQVVPRARAGAAVFPGVHENLRAVLNRASPEQVKFGLNWYPAEGRRLAEAAQQRGMTPAALAAIVAKFSQNSPWPQNLHYATKFIDQIHSGLTPETVKGIFATMAARNDAIAVMVGRLSPDAILKGPKETPFAHALMGEPSAVPVDRWMNRAAGYPLNSAGKPLTVAPAALRRDITEATTSLAEERGFAPSGAQAVIWDVIGGGRDPKTGLRRARGGPTKAQLKAKHLRRVMNPFVLDGDVRNRYRGMQPFSADSSWLTALDAGDIPEPEDTAYFDAMARSRGHMARGGRVDLEARALGMFGETDDIREAGYLTPSGRYLDFSGRSQAQGYRQSGTRFLPHRGPDYLAGQRSIDHREASLLFPRRARKYDSESIDWMLDQGFIRVGAGFWGNGERNISANLSRPTTDAQFRRLAAEGRDATHAFVDAENEKGRRLASFETQWPEDPVGGRKMAGFLRSANDLLVREGRAGGGWAEAYRQTLANRGGTFDAAGVSPKRGYAVELGQGPLVPGGDRRAFARAYKQMLGMGPFVGTWIPEGDDRIWMGASDVLGRRRTAEVFAKRQAQHALYDIGHDREIYPKWNARYPSPGQLKLPGLADGGLIRGIQSAFPRARLDLTRFPDKDLRLLLEAAVPLAEKYPLTAGRLKALGFDPTTQRSKTVNLGGGKLSTSSVMATTYSPNWDMIRFDKDAPLVSPLNHGNTGVPSSIMFQNRVVDYARKSRLRGFRPDQDSLVDPSLGGLFAHEFGHAVDYMHGTIPRYNVPESIVSKYAQTNRNENFAELFTGAERGGFLGSLRYQVEDLLDRISAREKYLVQPGMNWTYEEGKALGKARGGRVPKSTWAYGASNPLVGRLLDKAMADQGYDYKGGQFNRDSTGLGLRDVRQTIPWAWMPWSKNAQGGDVPPGTYVVNEIGRELFVPKRTEHLIPPDVAAQIPGGGLLARINAQKQAQAEPWKPAWMRRGLAKDITGQGRAGGGPTEIPGSGPLLWQAPEDGWIVPNRLMNKVPRAAVGRFVKWQGGMSYDSLTGKFVTPQERSDLERQFFNQGMVRRQERREDTARAERATESYIGRDSLISRINEGADLKTGRAVAAQRINAIGARTPRTFIGAVIGRGTTEAATEQLQESRAALAPYRRAVPFGIQPEVAISNEITRVSERRVRAETRLNEVQGRIAAGDETQIRRAGRLRTIVSGLSQAEADLGVHAETVAKARHLEEDAIKNLTGPRALTRQFLTLTAGFTAYQLALEGVGKAVQIAAVTAQPMIDRLTGFSVVADETTKTLAQSSRELGGNVQAAIARAAPAVGASGLAFLQGAAPGITARAGAGAAQDTLRLFQTALAFRSGSAVPGVFQGQGGLLGGPLLAEQLGGQIGIGEVLGRGVGDFQSTAARAQNPTVSGKLSEALGQRTGIPSGIFDPVLDFASGIAGLLPGGNKANEIFNQALPQTPADIEKQKAAMQGLAEWTKTFNDAAGRAVETGGAQVTGLKLVSAAAAGVTEEMYNNADAFAKFGDYAKGTGLVLVDANKQITTNFAKAQQTLLNSAQGFQIETPEALAARTSRELQGGRKTTAFQGEFERNTQIPGQLGLELLANPFPAASTGFKFADKGEEARFRPVIAGIAADQKSLMDEANAGLDQQRAFVKSWVPELTGQFETALTQIGHYGTQIANLNAASADAQAALANANYVNNRRILVRSLADAKALRDGGTGRQLRAGGDNLGAIQRAEFEIGRAAQQLSMALSQRQINFQTAVAGFQAPGITGQERAARTAEAQLEASYAQRQLNLQRQQFTLEGQAFTVTARRAVVDARAALDLEKQAHDTQLFVLGNQKQIATNQLHLSKAQANATSILNQAAQNQGAVLGVVDARLKLFGGTVEAVMNQIRTAAGLEPIYTTGKKSGPHAPGAGQASGILFDTAGPTNMTVGEAGQETVAVLRNPRSVDLGADRGMTGGAQAMQIGPIIVTGNTISSELDLDRLAMIVADKVESRLGATAKLIGIPQAR